MSEHPFAALSPDLVLNAVESLDLLTDARIMPLNSYENRVYQVGIEEQAPLIAKFYRPERWSDEQILEEHAFTAQLADCDVPVVQPLVFNQHSLFEFEGYRFALFPRQGGYAPEPGNLDQLYRLGQLLGRMHAVGASHKFKYRRTLNVQYYGVEARQLLLESGFIPPKLLTDWQQVTTQLVDKITQILQQRPYHAIRIHGDCHPGNLLYRDEAFFVVDFDDSKIGPAVQDFWMLLEGNYEERCQQMSELIEGYQEFYDFDYAQLHLIEILRALRMLSYSAWLAQRWSDPAFPKCFPWFTNEQYWYDQLSALRIQIKRLEEPTLRLANLI